MTTAAADLRTAFLADIIAHPEDDTPRLVFADWLQDNEDAARAEFIRVQCELARLGAMAQLIEGSLSLATADRHAILRHRERELLDPAAHWSGWLRPAFSDLADDVGIATDGQRQIVRLYGPRKQQLAEFRCEFRRGFPAHLTCRSTDWWGIPGQPGHGPALVRACPLEWVEVSGVEPETNHGFDCPYHWLWAEDLPNTMPLAIWRLLESPRHATPEAARAALSAACLAWARLPPCGECGGTGAPGKDAAILGGAGDPYAVLCCRPCHGLGRAVPA